MPPSPSKNFNIYFIMMVFFSFFFSLCALVIISWGLKYICLFIVLFVPLLCFLEDLFLFEGSSYVQSNCGLFQLSNCT